MSAKPPTRPPTKRERTTNFLLYGFALSILLHLLIGPLVQFKRTPEAPEKVETVKIDRMPTPPPTPKPTPKPTPTPPPTPPPKQTPPPPKSTPQPPHQAIKINTLHTKSSASGTEAGNTHTTGSANGSPQGTATGPVAPPAPAATPVPPTPTPVPTPTPLACAVPNADAKTINAAEPETPAIAQQQGITGEVIVQVSLDENSHLVSASIVKSPSALLNNAALAAARASRFQTRIANCKPVADSYNFIVDFQSQ
jgi:TonB family protein